MRKINLFIFLSALIIGLAGCKQDDIFNAAEQALIDDAAIVAYLEDLDIFDEAIKDEDSGLYYIIIEEGSGAKPTFGSSVITHYSGYFLSGQLFDTSLETPGPFDFVLGRGDVIAGWERGFTLIEKGTRALFLIPSGLAYGNNGSTGIPPNTVLQFDTHLIDVR